MNLRSGSPLWLPTNLPVKTYWKEDIETDVLIVGMGISGALVAHRLCQDGMTIAMVDYRPPGGGSTRASTAIIQYELDNPLWKLSEELGEKAASFIYHQSFKGVEELARLVQEFPAEEQKAIQYTSRPTLQLAYNEKESEELLCEFKARVAAGFKMSWLDSPELQKCYPFEYEAAIFNRDAATLNPVALIESLLREAVRKGVRLYGKTEVLDFAQQGSSLVVEVNDERRIYCRRIIFASGYETKTLLNLSCGKLTSSYAGATYPLAEVEPWRESAIIWEARQPYHYLRSTADGRIIIGGRDKPFRNEFMRDALIPLEHLRLRSTLRKMLGRPELEFEFFWNGTFAESDDGLPFIGPHPDHQNVFVILGCGGNGITFAALARELARDWIKGNGNALAPYFSLEREEEEKEEEHTASLSPMAPL